MSREDWLIIKMKCLNEDENRCKWEDLSGMRGQKCIFKGTPYKWMRNGKNEHRMRVCAI